MCRGDPVHPAGGIPWGNVALTAMILAGGLACANVVHDHGHGKQTLEETMDAGERLRRGVAKLAKDSAESYIKSFSRAFRDAAASAPPQAPSKSLGGVVMESTMIWYLVVGGMDLLAACTSRRLMRWRP